MRLALVSILCLLLAAPAFAQRCGTGLPCGQIPWALPEYPNLASPSPLPTFEITATPSATPGVTPTPLPTQTPLIDTDEIDSQMATIRAIVDSTTVPIADGSVPQAIGEQAALFFGYAKGLGQMNLGVLSPLLAFFLFAFVTVLMVKMTGFLLPVVSALFGLIRKAVQIVLDFLPL